MQKKIIGIIIGILLLVIGGALRLNDETLLYSLRYPLSIPAQGLRQMSEASNVLNVFAWVFLVVLSLSPFLLLTVLKNVRRRDVFALGALATTLFFVLYFMVNAHSIYQRMPAFTPLIEQTLRIHTELALSFFYYSLMILYVFMRIVLKGEVSLKRLIKVFFVIMMTLYVLVFSLSIWPNFLDSLRVESAVLRGFSVLEFIFRTMLFVLAMLLFYQSMQFVMALIDEKTQYNKKILVQSARLTVLVSLLMQATVLFYQLVFVGHFEHLNFTLDVPLLMVLYALILLVVVSFKEQKHALEDELGLMI